MLCFMAIIELPPDRHWMAGAIKNLLRFSTFIPTRLRMFAPPILMFSQTKMLGARKGYREFCGYGVPVRCTINTQREKKYGQYFTNLAIELVLFNLSKENEFFDWAWIDARRDGRQYAGAILELAPEAWREWVRNGGSAIERCCCNVAKNKIVKRATRRQ